MANYAEILAFLADNPPQLDSDRELHASLLELLAESLRSNHGLTDDEDEELLDTGEIRWVSVN